MLIVNLRLEQYDNNEKVNQQGFEEVLSFCIKEGNNAMDDASMHKLIS